MSWLDNYGEDDYWHDDRDEARTEAARQPNPGPLERAIDAGYDPADWTEQ